MNLKSFVGAASRRSRDNVIKQIGERWYKHASEALLTDRGRKFLERFFLETLEPDRVREEEDRSFVQIAALGYYMRQLNEVRGNALDYDKNPDLDLLMASLLHARLAVPSALLKDNIYYHAFDSKVWAVDDLFYMMDGNKHDGFLTQNLRYVYDFSFNIERGIIKLWSKDLLSDIIPDLDKRQFDRGVGMFAVLLSRRERGKYIQLLAANDITPAMVATLERELTSTDRKHISIVQKIFSASESPLKELAYSTYGLLPDLGPDYVPIQPGIPGYMPIACDDPFEDKWALARMEDSGFLTNEKFRTPNQLCLTEQRIQLNLYEVTARHLWNAARFVASEPILHAKMRLVKEPVFCKNYGDLGQALLKHWLRSLIIPDESWEKFFHF